MKPDDFKPKEVLRQNVQACLGWRHGPSSQMELSRKSKVGQATIGRILSAEGNNAEIETIAKIAEAYGLEPWMLLIPGMDPGNPPVLQPASQEQRALWDRLRALGKDIAEMEKR